MPESSRRSDGDVAALPGRKIVYRLVASLAVVNCSIEVVALTVIPVIVTTRSPSAESLLDAFVSTSIAALITYVYILRPLERRLRATWDALQRSLQETEQLARIDPLTQVANRRSFFEEADRELSRARRNGISLACIMLDVDHFKHFNDQHGHSVGDAVLKGVAHLLAGSCRKGDLVCRYGGEEFCILLTQADLTAAQQFAERIRCNVAGYPICHGEQQFHLTISLGVAVANQNTICIDELIEDADQALLQAKTGGRNQVVTVGFGREEVNPVVLPVATRP